MHPFEYANPSTTQEAVGLLGSRWGEVDVLAVLKAVQAGGYNGWAVFEQDVDPTKPGVVPKASAAASRQYLRDAAGI